MVEGNMTERTANKKRRRDFLRTLSATTVGLGGVARQGSAVRSTRTDKKSGQQTETVTRFHQSEKLAANDGGKFDRFGSSVALSNDGTTAVIGAHGDNVNNHEAAGSAYVFKQSGDSWHQQQKLVAADGNTAVSLGISVALSGDATTAIVGTLPDRDYSNEGGSLYIFEPSGDSWHQQQKLTPEDGENNSWLGPAVASEDGTTIVCGSHFDPGNNQPFGVAYIFGKSGDSWGHVATLTTDESDDPHNFGRSVAVSGDGTTAVVGNPRIDTTEEWTSSVYIFEQAGNTWHNQQRLTPDDEQDTFGSSVAISGDGTTTAISAFDPDVEAGGSAYIFERSAEAWGQQRQLTVDDGEVAFGEALAVSNDGRTVLVGTKTADPNGKQSGTAYAFERSGGGWHQKLIPDDNDRRDRFGESVAISADGQTALGSAIWDDDPNGNRAGSAYVFEKSEVTAPTTGDGIAPAVRIGTAIAALGAGGYLLRRRFIDDSTTQD